MCTGRVDPAHIVDAFLAGNDGVMVLGCRIGECHYSTGNIHAERRVKWTKRFLGAIGISPERLHIGWVSSAEDEKVVAELQQFNRRIGALGPSGDSDPVGKEDLEFSLRALKDVLLGEKIRWLVEKEDSLSGKENVFGQAFPGEDYEVTLKTIFNVELLRKKTILLLRKKASTVEELSKKLDLPPRQIFRHVTALRLQGAIELSEIKEGEPVYAEAKGVQG